MTGLQFHNIRKSLNLTQKQLADILETNNVTISQQENKKNINEIYANAIRYLAIKDSLMNIEDLLSV